MSIRIMSRVWAESAQEGGSLLVLLALADWSDDDGRCFPSIEKLAKKARLSERQVQRVLRDLEDAKEIEIADGGGRHKVNVYKITMDKIPRQNVTLCEGSKTVTSETETVTSEAQKGDMGVTPYVIDPSENRHIASPAGAAPAVEESIPPNEVAADEPKKDRKRNELLDTLAKIDGADPLKVPPMGWSKYAKVLKNVKAVVPEITPEILLRAAKKYRQIHPTWELTATALASHWGECYIEEKAEPQKTLAEPAGWREFVDRNMPDCPYAGVQIAWGKIDPEHQVWINTAMIEDLEKRGVA